MLAVVVPVVVIACAGNAQIVTAPVDVDMAVPVPAVILVTALVKLFAIRLVTVAVVV